MTPEDAVTLIISEARADGDSLLACVREGLDPGQERMRRLITALRVIYQTLSKQAELDRHLAAALFTLGSDFPLTISSLASKGQSWRKGFMEEEVYEMLMGVQGIFEDRWPEPDSTETIH
jgi:hypothetical protein